MSLADLAMTLTHASTIGFAEANPIARALMDTGSATPVTLWKLGSLVVAFGILFYLRRTRIAELAAWLVVAILGWLMLRWSVYNDHVQLLSAELSTATTSNVCWVQVE